MNKQKVILNIDSISLRFGGVIALQDVSLQVMEHELLAIIGPNGAGKSCLFNCINGFYVPYAGEIIYRDIKLKGMKPHKITHLGVGRMFQNIGLYEGMTVLDNLMSARGRYLKYGWIAAALRFGKAIKEEIRNRLVVEDILDFLELEPYRKTIVGLLPYGLRKRVELGRTLALEPDLMLLDEPMAGMNLEEKEDMARFILDIQEERDITIIMVEHDMGLVVDIAERIIAIDFGRKIAEGVPSEVVNNPIVIQAYIGKENLNSD